MPLHAQGTTFAEPQDLSQPAVLAGVYDIGLHAIQERFQKPGGPSSNHKIILFYELRETNPETGRRFCQSVFCNNKLFRGANTTKLLTHVDALAGHVLSKSEIKAKPDLEQYVGACVFLQLGENDDGDFGILSVGALQDPDKDSFTADWEWTGQEGNLPKVVETMRGRAINSDIPF